MTSELGSPPTVEQPAIELPLRIVLGWLFSPLPTPDVDVIAVQVLLEDAATKLGYRGPYECFLGLEVARAYDDLQKFLRGES